MSYDPRRPQGQGGSPTRRGEQGRGNRLLYAPETGVSDHWPEYLQDTHGTGAYFDAGGNLREEYVSRAKVEPLIERMAKDSPKLTTGQLRRFFSHCRSLETRLQSGANTWEELYVQFKFLDAAASDAYGKTPRKIPHLFYDFIRRNVAAVHTKHEFLKGFLPHFEALVGFGSLHVQKERN